MCVCVFCCFACLIFYYFVIYLTSNFNKPQFLLFFVVSSSTFSPLLCGVVGVCVCFSLSSFSFSILALN